MNFINKPYIKSLDKYQYFSSLFTQTQQITPMWGKGIIRCLFTARAEGERRKKVRAEQGCSGTLKILMETMSLTKTKHQNNGAGP